MKNMPIDFLSISVRYSCFHISEILYLSNQQEQTKKEEEGEGKLNKRQSINCDAQITNVRKTRKQTKKTKQICITLLHNIIYSICFFFLQ